MKQQNYRHEDVTAVLETRRAILHQLEQVEMNLWTDNVNEAIKRTKDIQESLMKLKGMQSIKQLDDQFEQFIKFMNANIIEIEVINGHFKHKKTD